MNQDEMARTRVGQHMLKNQRGPNEPVTFADLAHLEDDGTIGAGAPAEPAKPAREKKSSRKR